MDFFTEHFAENQVYISEGSSLEAGDTEIQIIRGCHVQIVLSRSRQANDSLKARDARQSPDERVGAFIYGQKRTPLGRRGSLGVVELATNVGFTWVAAYAPC